VENSDGALTVAPCNNMILISLSFENLDRRQLSVIKNTSTKLKIGLTCDYPSDYPQTTPKYLCLARFRGASAQIGRWLP